MLIILVEQKLPEFRMTSMKRTRIKICGVRDPETAIAASESGADAIGLVFATDSPRCVTVEQACRICEALPPFVEPVGLFVDAPVEQIREVAVAVGLRTVQLHGREVPGEVAELAPLRVIKSLAFEANNFGSALEPWLTGSIRPSGILFEAPRSHHNQSDNQGALVPSGGSGECLDWESLAQSLETVDLSGMPVILAGGLTSDNVGRAVATVKPFGVDVSTGVESSRGVKSVGLIEAFCQAVAG